ncbi:MAG: TolC family protein [Myxococcales bacterium]|nr:TolC family protein [Myxococcota bacterium]MDW8280333.1 TolC family protein [Myxococcales bacterium]
MTYRWTLAAPALVVAVVAPGICHGQAPATRRLDLHQLWDQVQSRFPGLRAARHAVRAAHYTLDEQKWLALPSGEINTFLSWSPSIRCMTPAELDLNVGGNPLVAGRAQPQPVGGSQHCLSTTVSLNLLQDNLANYLPNFGALLRIDARVVQPIFTFGKLWAAIDLGRVGLDIARANEEVARMDLAMHVVRAYFGLKTARAALDTVREGREQITKWIERIDRDLEQGKGSYTEIDLMRLKVADSQVEMAELDLKRTIEATLRAVRYLAQDETVDVDEANLEVFADETRDLDYYLDMALVRRPDLKVLEATGRGALAFRKLRIAELLPDLAFLGTFSFGLAQGVTDEPFNAFMNRLNYLGASAGLVLRWNLDFGPRVARLQRALADVAQFQARRVELLGGAALEVQRTFLDLREARQRLAAAEIAERRARGWLQGIKQNIDVGTAESRDMIDALRSYFDQHLLVLRTINDVNVQAATLRRLVGMEVIPPHGEQRTR